MKEKKIILKTNRIGNSSHRQLKRISALEISEAIFENVSEDEIFSIIFIKKDGQKRSMIAKYSFDDIQTDKMLILTDTQKQAYRRVKTESVLAIKTKRYNFKIE